MRSRVQILKRFEQQALSPGRRRSDARFPQLLPHDVARRAVLQKRFLYQINEFDIS